MDKKIKKESFLELLSYSTPEEINKIIEQKGKQPKPVKPIIILKK